MKSVIVSNEEDRNKDQTAEPHTRVDGRSPHPIKKDASLNFRVSAELKARAELQAQIMGRSLADIIRAWLEGFANGEFPSPPVPTDEKKRAPGGGRKKMKNKEACNE